MKFEVPYQLSSILYFLIVFWAWIQYGRYKLKFNREEKLTNKKWLFQNVILNGISISIVGVANIFFSVGNLFRDNIQIHILMGITCFAQVVLIWFLYLMQYKIVSEFETSEKKLNIL